MEDVIITLGIDDTVYFLEWAILSINDVLSLIKRPGVNFTTVDTSNASTVTIAVPAIMDPTERLFVWTEGYHGVFMDDLRKGATYEWLCVLASTAGVLSPMDPPMPSLLDRFTSLDELEIFVHLGRNIELNGAAALWDRTVRYAFVPPSIELRFKTVWTAILKGGGDPRSVMDRDAVAVCSAVGADALVVLPRGDGDDEVPVVAVKNAARYLEELSERSTNRTVTEILAAPTPPFPIPNFGIGVLTDRVKGLCEVFIIIKDSDRWMFDRYTFALNTCMIGNVISNGLGIYETTLAGLERTLQPPAPTSRPRFVCVVRDGSHTEAGQPVGALGKCQAEPWNIW
ncbi:ORF23 [Ictalurid herpesvirus 1]|nr:ORF23 [Ictalurid herpesvirus 1]